MPCVLIGFVDRVICMDRDGFRVMLQRTPEVCDHAIQVVYGFGARRMRTTEENSTGTEKWLHVIWHVAESVPDEMGDAGLTAESPGERRFVAAVPQTSIYTIQYVPKPFL